jgi:AraC-like DNA-binding protein
MNKTGVKIIRNFPDWPDDIARIRNWNSQFVNSNVIINANSRAVYYPKHWTVLSIKCAFGGSEYYVTDKMKYRVDDSCFLLLNEGSIYESYINADERVNSFTINFAPHFAADALKSIMGPAGKLLDDPFDSGKSDGTVRFSEQLYKLDEQVLQILKTLKSSLSSGCESLLIHEQFHFLLQVLFQKHEELAKKVHNIPKARRSTKVEIYKRLTQARDYLDSNFNENVELHDIARIVSMCEHHLLREFRKYFGITPHRYLSNRRLEEAARILRSTDIPVSQVASMVGFEYLSSFSKFFTKKHKISPTDFRKSSG